VDHRRPVRDSVVDLDVLGSELARLLAMAREQRMTEVPWLRKLPAELLELKEVALSGDGEPTLCPQFAEVVETVVHRRARERRPFKIVLITNTSGLGLPEVERGLRMFTPLDEVWVKVDAGSQSRMDLINRSRSGITLDTVLNNILTLARQRPVVIQSLFPRIGDEPPDLPEIEQYARRLKDLRAAGAQIALVQIYSAHRPPHRPDCSHLPLKHLSFIAHRVREVAGLRAEVF
jgi:wyosine [tRNA(Phe)-imidazoG37] synthetase (radical SAM superfamily)